MDGTCGSLRLVRFRSREPADRLVAKSELGDSVRRDPTMKEEDRLLSLSPASLPIYNELRWLTECERPWMATFWVYDRGVGHSIGLVDLDDAIGDGATEDCRLRSSDTKDGSEVLCFA